MINIPLVDEREDLDCCSRKYRRAIYNVLLALKPTYCLEIGSYLFQSSSVWSKYYEETGLNGRLITCDIAKWTNSNPPPYVEQVMVYPHINNIKDNHGGINIYHKEWENCVESSVEYNIEKIEEVMRNWGIASFNLSFVDGDHSRVSFLKDLEIAQSLTNNNGWILIDDVNDQGHDQYQVYRELKEKGNVFYEFENFSPNPGIALIRNADLVV